MEDHMSQRGSLALIPRTKKGFVLFWTAILMLTLAFQYAAAATPQSALALSGAIYSSNFDGTIVNQNHYATKPDVYLTGGPCQGGSHLDPGDYYFEVSNPDTANLLSTDAIGNRKFTVGANGFITSTSGTHGTHAVGCSGVTGITIQLIPFLDTTNPGGEYKLTVATAASVEACKDFNAEAVQSICGAADQKSDNFKVLGPGTLKITKAVDGGDFSGSFPVSVDCGAAGNFNGTIVFPSPGFITFKVDAGAECTVTEGTLPAPPAGFTFGQPTYSGNPATIVSDDTVTVGITNHLNVIPAPALTIDKGVSLSASGPFAASLTTEIGTTVHYRITVTNTGNVPLTGVTLTDNKFDLVAKGCTIPTTLAVGQHFDCDYTSTAVAGETVNTATADSAETDSAHDSATVTGTTTPGIRVRKAVGLSADGPFVNILNVAPGTTVHYRITVTNTGNVALTGVTLTDNVFNLVDKGCTIPTTLAVGASFNCDYSSVSAETSTVNTATGDSNETGPDSDSATVNPVAQQLTPVLAIAKSNNAPAAPGGAKEGDTVTYTLDYTITDGPADNGVITDKLPAGVTYVTGSATDSENGEFVFDGYDSATRTLTWVATQVSENDSVSYKVTVDTGAAALSQPLVNNACINATGAAEDCDTSDVFVAPPPLAETSVPTAPRTDVLDSSGTATPGMNLGLVLLIIGALAFAVLFVTPMPASTKNRIRRR